MKRKRELLEAEALRARRVEAGPPRCALCGRLLGARVEWHHFLPKSRGGTETVPVHPICHRAIHAHVSNAELATSFADVERLREREDMRRFLDWIADKPANFSAPTRRARGR